jgi:peptide/nickel transport system substrate-binding protein
MKSKLSLTALLALLALAFAACAPVATVPPTTAPPAAGAPTEVAAPTGVPAATAAAAEGAKKLTWAFALGTNCLDPAFQTGSPDANNMYNIYDSLVAHKNDSLTEVDPALATSWEVSPDGLTYTFQLRPGVKWHGGYGEVTAEDVKYSYDRMKNPETKAAGGAFLKPIESIEVVDPLTVRLNLSTPNPPLLLNLAHDPGAAIVNQKAVEERGREHCLRPIGTGPYEVTSAETNGGVTMQAFADAWRGKPAIDQVEMRVIPEESVAVLALKSGEIDFMVPRDPVFIQELRKTPGVVVNGDEKASASFYALWLNNSREPFDDPNVRKALIHAIDRETLVNSVTEGMITQVANSVVPPNLVGHTSDVTVYPYDLELAKSLLKEAGHESGFEITAEAIRTSDNPAMLTVVQNMWKELGVTLNISFLDRAAIRANQAAGNFDITVSNPTRAEVDGIMDYFRCQNIPGSNFPQYRGVCDLIDQQASTADPAERVRLLEEIQKKIAEDAPIVPLWYPIEVTAARDYVTGMIPNLAGWQTRFYHFDLDKQ